MKIDYYCFVMDKFGQQNYNDMLYRSELYENFNFDIDIAKSINKFAVFCKETGQFYDKNWNTINLDSKLVFPRCAIPDTEILYSALDKTEAIQFISKQDYNMVESWPNYINARYRDVILTTYKDFLLNYKTYKEKFGKVFFKTKHKNISEEIITVVHSNPGEITLLSSDNDTSEEKTSFFNKDVYAVYTNRYSSKRKNMMINDIRFCFLKEDDEVFVQPLLNLKKDRKYKHIPVEYRSFVVNGKFVTSRSWIPNREVPEEVKDITQSIIDNMPNDMNKTFVVDVRGSPSSQRVQELKKNQQIERQSAYDPMYRSYHKKQDLQPCYLGAKYGLYHHQMLQRSMACQPIRALSYKYQLLGVGNELGW